MEISPPAVVCGMLMGIGLWLVIFRSPFMRAVTLSQRIEPQLKSQNLESRLLRAGTDRAGAVASVTLTRAREAVGMLAR